MLPAAVLLSAVVVPAPTSEAELGVTHLYVQFANEQIESQKLKAEC